MGDWTTARREQYFKASPDNFADKENKAFPIADAHDVEESARLHGHAKNPAAVKKSIIAIAKRLNLAHALLDEWKMEQGIKEQGTITLDAQLRILETVGKSDQPGHDVRVTIIQGGKSANSYRYDQPTLQNIARLVEGAHAYSDHARSSADESNRSIRDIIGFYHDAQYIPPTQDPAGSGRVDATLHIFEGASWLWSLVQEAAALGRPELIGLSIDILGQWQHNRDTQSKDVTNVVALNSCDIVTRPSAGGKFQRILHDMQKEQQNTIGEETMLTGLQDVPLNPNSLPGGDPAAPPPVQAPPAEPPVPVVAPAPDPAVPHVVAPGGTPASSAVIITEERNTSLITESQRISEQTTRLTEQSAQLMAELKQERDALRQERAATYLDRRLMESVLPDPVRNMVRARFSGRIFEQNEIDKEINAQQDMLAALTSQGLIRGNGYEKPGTVTGMISEAEKVQACFDKLFDLDIDTARLGNIRAFGGIREAYMRVTGDSQVQGGISGNSQLGMIRVSESAPITRISEADTTTASFSYLLGSSMNKRLLKDYQAWPAEWMKFCTIAPIRDFKQQVRVRFGAFGSLSTVPEDTAYTTVTLTDSAATYVPQKRGNLVTVSRESIINDDLMAIKQVPTKLAVAAAYTLAEFVYTFLSGNGNIYDGAALFTSGGGSHLNLGSSALSSSSIQSGVTAMREQLNYAGKRIGLRPRYLIVPPELEWTAMVITKSAGVPGSSNNDINPMLGYVTPVIAPQLSSTTQWFLAGDPREIDTIEVGFVGGMMNPALFIQDSPVLGLNFTQDAVSFKIRHEYGGAVVDYRGLYRGI